MSLSLCVNGPLPSVVTTDGPDPIGSAPAVWPDHDACVVVHFAASVYCFSLNMTTWLLQLQMQLNLFHW
jgi:hypothetical protein